MLNIDNLTIVMLGIPLLIMIIEYIVCRLLGIKHNEWKEYEN
jgi:hypothetical protein